MTSRPTLPPDLEAGLADYPDLAPGDLAPPWRLAEGANPLHGAPAPDPARIRAIQTALAQTAANGMAIRPALRLFRPARFLYGMAAAVALLVAAGLFLWQKPITVSAPYGAIASVDLPDGSHIQLNSGSTLTYARRFMAKTRRVHLDGEAFFDVAQAGTPFVIETFNANVTVLGTSFNVRAWADAPDARTVVSVETGMVEVSAKETPDEALRLGAGEAAHVTDDDAPLPQVLADPTMALAWRDRRFVFINQSLGVMFDEIERRFGIEILAPEKVRSHIHNIKTNVTTADSLVGELCQSVTTMQLRYRAIANGFEIFEE